MNADPGQAAARADQPYLELRIVALPVDEIREVTPVFVLVGRMQMILKSCAQQLVPAKPHHLLIGNVGVQAAPIQVQAGDSHRRPLNDSLQVGRVLQQSGIGFFHHIVKGCGNLSFFPSRCVLIQCHHRPPIHEPPP